ncbi:hypothetical protein KEM55_002267 [Ascosphaera atra]|nr:hypothetical protein KEM55_002267 [Ascosphaera atra]
MFRIRTTALLGALILLAIISLIFSSSSLKLDEIKSKSSSYTSKLPDITSFHLGGYNPFGPAVHKPAEQQNSTAHGSKWHSDWRWLHPFSSAVTLDENRSVLPPLRTRPNVYTYYDAAAAHKSKAESEADRQLLLSWRRAWFSQGFRPVVLGPAEARNNPIFESFQARKLKLAPELEQEILRWLAWGSMETGIMVDRMAYPMGAYSDKFLTTLRAFKGEVEKDQIISWQHAGRTALLAGERSFINDVIKKTVDNPEIINAKGIAEVQPRNVIVSRKSKAIALYDDDTVKGKYPPIAEKLGESAAEGKEELKDLINAHLQTTFLNTYGSGINVLRPFPGNASVLATPSLRLASLLVECARSPMPKSCPPNRQSCKPCDRTTPKQVKEIERYQADANSYTLSVVPHPYTLAGLFKQSMDFTISYLRRNTTRDNWVNEVTEDLIKKEVNDLTRVVALKNIVAGDETFYRNLFFTVESFPAQKGKHNLPNPVLQQLDWQLGFIIPRRIEGESDADAEKAFKPEDEDQAHWDKQYELVAHARRVIVADMEKDKNHKEAKELQSSIDVKTSTEAWNMADTEVWKFVKAYM